MRRAKTITGLLLQTLRLRWASLGSRGKTFTIIGLVLAAAAALHLGACFLGACPASGCRLGASPCSRAQSTEPCALRARAAAAEDAEGDVEGSVPPCHRR